MKKNIVFLVSMILLLSLSGCTSSPKETQSDDSQQTTSNSNDRNIQEDFRCIFYVFSIERILPRYALWDMKTKKKWNIKKRYRNSWRMDWLQRMALLFPKHK